MKRSYLVFKNVEGETTRVLPFRNEELELIYNQDTRRVEFVSDSAALKEEGVEFQKLGEASKTSAPGAVIYKGTWGRVEHVAEVEDTSSDIQEREDRDPKDFTFFLKWTSGVQVGALALILAGSAIFSALTKEPEVEVVTVFKQTEPLKKPVEVVQVSEKKVVEKQPERFRKKAVVKKVVTTRLGKSKGVSERSGDSLSKMGALGALGGMNKNSTGAGGLSQAKSNSQGFGFDSTRAAGGNNRGMLGKGLVSAGIGGGGSMTGYGGNGTRGKGSGQAGYGHVGMAGRSGGYYLPLSDDASVEGGLDREQIQAVVDRNQGQAVYCYEKGIQSNPGLGGRVMVKFVVSPSGAVSSASVASSSMGSSSVESCIVNKLRAWRFPRPKGNVAVRVNYPFNFKRLNQG